MSIKPTGLNLPVDSKHLTIPCIVVVKILCEEIVVSEYFFMLSHFTKLTLFRVTLLMGDILDFFSPFIATWAGRQSREYEQHCLV